MPKRDGSIVFETKLDNKKLDKELNAVNAKIRKLKDNVENLKTQRMPLAEQMKAYGTRLDDARRKLEALKAEQARVNEILNPSNPANHVSYDEYIDAYMRKDSINADVKRQQEEVDKLSKEWENAGKKVRDYDQKIKQATNNLNAATAQAGELSKKQAQAADGGKKLREETEKARKSMDKTAGTLGKVMKRIGGVAASAFIFSVAYRGFNALSKYLGSMITTNERFSKSLEVIKGNLLTAFQPIFEAVLPALEWLLDVVTDVTRGIAQFVAVLFGKDVKATAEAAKNQYEMAGAIEETGDAAKQAAKQLLPFDELNILETNASVDTSGVTEGAEEIGASFELIEDAETESWVDTLTNSNFGKGFVQFWESLKEILTNTFATIWDGVVSAFNWFWEILEDADPDVIDAVLMGITTAIGLWLGYKTVSTIINKVKTALSGFLSAISAHPVAAIAIAVASLAVAIGEYNKLKFENSEWGKLVDSIEDIGEKADESREAVENLLEECELKESEVEKDYAGITLIADKYSDLSQKATLTDEDKSLLAVYKKQLDEYAPGMITNIDEVTGAWKGTREELQQIIDKQYESYMVQAYEDIFRDLYKQAAQTTLDINEAQEALKNAEKEIKDYEKQFFEEKANSTYDTWVYDWQVNLGLYSGDRGIFGEVLHYGEAWENFWRGDLLNDSAYIKLNEALNNASASVDSLINAQGDLNQKITNVESIIKETSKQNALPDQGLSTTDKQALEKIGSNLANAIIKGFEAGAISMKIPGLATGAVIPANREFVARLGDNTTETEVVSPLSTMKQAFKEALAEMGGINTGNYTAVLEVDGKELGRVLLPTLKKEQKRKCTSLVKG